MLRQWEHLFFSQKFLRSDTDFRTQTELQLKTKPKGQKHLNPRLILSSKMSVNTQLIKYVMKTRTDMIKATPKKTIRIQSDHTLFITHTYKNQVQSTSSVVYSAQRTSPEVSTVVLDSVYNSSRTFPILRGFPSEELNLVVSHLESDK